MAEANCLKEGASLASIHSEEENNFLLDLAKGNSYWIGGYPKDSSWVWSDFTDLDFTAFYDMVTGECMYQKEDEYSFGWNTVSCSSSDYEKGYICKVFQK